MHQNLAAKEKEEEYFTETFEKRHSNGDEMEKWRITNFITRSNHRKRTHRQSVNV